MVLTKWSSVPTAFTEEKSKEGKVVQGTLQDGLQTIPTFPENSQPAWFNKSQLAILG